MHIRTGARKIEYGPHKYFGIPTINGVTARKAGISYITHYGTEMRRHTTECITHTYNYRIVTFSTIVFSIIVLSNAFFSSFTLMFLKVKSRRRYLSLVPTSKKLRHSI